jgi:hypothetical protein
MRARARLEFDLRSVRPERSFVKAQESGQRLMGRRPQGVSWDRNDPFGAGENRPAGKRHLAAARATCARAQRLTRPAMNPMPDPRRLITDQRPRVLSSRRAPKGGARKRQNGPNRAKSCHAMRGAAIQCNSAMPFNRTPRSYSLVCFPALHDRSRGGKSKLDRVKFGQI